MQKKILSGILSIKRPAACLWEPPFLGAYCPGEASPPPVGTAHHVTGQIPVVCALKRGPMGLVDMGSCGYSYRTVPFLGMGNDLCPSIIPLNYHSTQFKTDSARQKLSLLPLYFNLDTFG